MSTRTDVWSSDCSLSRRSILHPESESSVVRRLCYICHAGCRMGGAIRKQQCSAVLSLVQNERTASPCRFGRIFEPLAISFQQLDFDEDVVLCESTWNFCLNIGRSLALHTTSVAPAPISGQPDTPRCQDIFRLDLLFPKRVRDASLVTSSISWWLQSTTAKYDCMK